MVYECCNGNISIRFHVNNEIELNKKLIESYLYPYFECRLASSYAESDFSISPYRYSKVYIKKYEVNFKQKKFHLGRIGKEFYQNNLLFATYNEFPLAFYISNDRNILFCDMKTEVDYYDLVRFIMSFFEAKIYKLGYVKCHMAMVKVEDKCIALLGDKNMGKTTYLCNMLNDANHSVRLGANDKCYIKIKDGNSDINAVGNIEYIGIRRITSNEFIGLNNLNAFETEEMLFYWPRVLIDYFKAGHVKKTKIDNFVVPQIDMNSKEFTISKSYFEIETLYKILFQFSDDNHMFWLMPYLWDKFQVNINKIDENKEKICTMISKRGYMQISGNPYKQGCLNACILAEIRENQ